MAAVNQHFKHPDWSVVRSHHHFFYLEKVLLIPAAQTVCVCLLLGSFQISYMFCWMWGGTLLLPRWPAKANSCHASAPLQNLKGKLANSTCPSVALWGPHACFSLLRNSANLALDLNLCLISLMPFEYFMSSCMWQTCTGEGGVLSKNRNVVSVKK